MVENFPTTFLPTTSTTTHTTTTVLIHTHCIERDAGAFIAIERGVFER